ncbi:MAG: peptidyl-prolyl cis-trans isomerase [Oscillospiraceae bacterium]|nr:peptidyl-prolyl cis-trans isomerase [Oscillospiraceae bacterium]
MKIKKLLALALALTLLFTVLSACKKDEGNDGGAVGEFTPTPSDTATLPPSSDAEDGATFDYKAAFAAFEPETVMYTLSEIPVTWELMYFYVCSAIAGYEQYYGPITDWTVDNGEGQAAEVILAQALDNIRLYKTVDYAAKLNKLSFTAEELAELDAQREQEVEYNGGEEAFNAFLAANNATDAVYRYLLSVSPMYNKILTALYGENASAVTDAQALEYTEANGWLYAKHILISTVDDSGNPLPAGELEAARVKAETLLEELRLYSGADFDTYFDERMNADSADAGGLYSFPDGYIFGPGTMVPEFEEGTRALEPGAFDMVESDFGYHIIYRLPYNFDMVVYDSSGAQDTLRELTAYEQLNATFDAWEAALVRADAAFADFDLARVFVQAQ